MSRRRLPIVVAIAWLAVAVLTLVGIDSPAQTFDATNLDRPTELGETWRVHLGDDPSYAKPDFDDSNWIVVDTHKGLATYFPTQHPETVWYRLQVKTRPTQKGLALQEYNLSDAFEIYINGERILQLGRVAPYAGYTPAARLVVPVPVNHIEAGSFLLALRIHLSHIEYGGLYPGNLLIGQQDALRDHASLALMREHGILWLSSLLSFSVSLVAIALYASNRRQTEYLWIFLAGLSDAACTLGRTFVYTHHVPIGWAAALYFPAGSLYLLCTTLMYFAFLRVRMHNWLRIYLAIALPMNFITSSAHFLDLIPSAVSWAAGVVSRLPLEIVSYGVIPVMLVFRMRRGHREAGILLIPALLYGAAWYARELGLLASLIPGLRNVLTVMTTHYPSSTLWVLSSFLASSGPPLISLDQVCFILFWISLAAILVWRSNQVSKAQTRLESEIEAARQVQQVILPEPGGVFAGFHIESVYKPAQQVGGDFFQILRPSGGGLLLVFGDVAGKGLPAAMLVAVLVGAIRTIVRFTDEPAEILAELNTRLLGRSSSGFSTCMAAHIDPLGNVRLANAGQISPYLDGHELETPGALPLGIAPDQHYETLDFELQLRSRLVFYSDGVVEAQNKKGELLGFDRSQKLSALSAEEIVKAASDFGQSDDITVVVIEREATQENMA